MQSLDKIHLEKPTLYTNTHRGHEQPTEPDENLNKSLFSSYYSSNPYLRQVHTSKLSMDIFQDSNLFGIWLLCKVLFEQYRL